MVKRSHNWSDWSILSDALQCKYTRVCIDCGEIEMTDKPKYKRCGD